MSVDFEYPARKSGVLMYSDRPRGLRRLSYIRLDDATLSCSRRKDGVPTVVLNLTDSTLTTDTVKCEITLKLSNGKHVRLGASTEVVIESWTRLLTVASTRKVGKFYSIASVIGRGTYARVHEGIRKSDGLEVAIKVIKKRPRDKELMRSVQSELNICSQRIVHESIVRIYDVFNTPEHLFLAMEYMSGGTLLEKMEVQGFGSEMDVMYTMKSIFEALSYLHSRDVVHRDVKPENILCTNAMWPTKVKLTDFGLADRVVPDRNGDKTTKGLFGTPVFVAPEIVRGGRYGVKVDVWSAGVVMYNLLSGSLPFTGTKMRDVFRSVKKGSIDLTRGSLAYVSDEARELMRSLLQQSPADRPSAAEALEHPWFKLGFDLMDYSMDRELIESPPHIHSPVLFEVESNSSGDLDEILLAEQRQDVHSMYLPEEEIEGVEELLHAHSRSATKRFKPKSTRSESTVLPKRFASFQQRTTSRASSLLSFQLRQSTARKNVGTESPML